MSGFILLQLVYDRTYQNVADNEWLNVSDKRNFYL